MEQFHTYGSAVHAFDAVSSNTVQENEDEQGFDEDESFAILNPEEHMEKHLFQMICQLQRQIQPTPLK